MKSIFTFVLVVLSVSVASAQNVFHRGYYTPGNPDFANNGLVIQCANGDFLYNLQTAFFTLQAGLMRTDDTGEPIWVKDYQLVTGPDTQHYKIAQVLELPGGDLLMFGSVSAPTVYIIVRTDAAGNIQWSKSMPLASGNFSHRRALQCSNGDVMLCLTEFFSPGSNYMILTRMTPDGNLLWQHAYLNYANVGINDQFLANGVSECANGDFVVAGTGTAPTNSIIMRVDANGSVVWTKGLIDDETGLPHSPFDIQELPDGDLQLLIAEPGPGHALALLKLNAGGNVTGPGKAFNIGLNFYSDAKLTPTGDVIAVAAAKMVGIGSDGTVMFARQFTPPVSFLSLGAVNTTSDGGYVAAGSADQGPFSANGYMVKTGWGGAAEPFNTTFTVTDSVYTNASSDIVLFDSVVSVPLENITLTTMTRTLNDTLYALSVSVIKAGVNGTLLAYPNPVSKQLTITPQGLYDVSVYAFDGRLMKTTFNACRIDVATLAPGAYLVHVSSPDRRVNGWQKIVKE